MSEKELYRSVIAAMTEGVVVQDAAGTILACNAAAEAILGLTRDQMSGRTSLDPRWRAIHEDGSAFPGDTHPAMVTLRTGEACRDVVMGVHKADGSVTWIAINTQPIAAEDPTAPHVVCTFSDITSYKRALADLQASEARMQLAMDAARFGTWQWDIPADRVMWSDTVGDVFGVSRGMSPSGFRSYLDHIHPDDRAAVQREIDEVLAGDRDMFHLRHRVHVGAGAELRWIDGHGRVFRDAHGKPVRMAGIAIDVTDVVRLEHQVHHSQRLEAIGRLAGGIAHDFNNVLTVILSAVELRARKDRRADEELELIRDAAGRAAQLTGQLLAFARRRPAGVETVDLGALVENLRPLLGRLLGEHIALDVTIARGRWLVRADAGQLEQVVINLVANARDAIRDVGHVRVALDGGDDAVLVVEDDGSGMPAEVVEHIFEPFFTTKSAGTGLGLATSYGIVVQHGGRIEVASTPARGTRFEVHLPRIAEARPLRPRATTPRPMLPRGTETVLLVEDDPMIRRVAERILGDQGYRVLVASDGHDALAIADRHGDELALVLTDAVMPRMGGVELASQLHARWPTLPVLVLSGYDPDERAGASELPRLAKPYTPAELVHRVRDLLDRARS
ncbi:MAG: ATP-binding protein [Acidobacteriota bacterium]